MPAGIANYWSGLISCWNLLGRPSMEIPVWNLCVLLWCTGKCPCSFLTSQDSRRWKAQMFHSRENNVLAWQTSGSAAQSHQHPAHQQSCTCCVSFRRPCLRITAPWWPCPLITYADPPRSNLLFCLQQRPSAFTKVWCLKLYDRAIGSCPFF